MTELTLNEFITKFDKENKKYTLNSLKNAEYVKIKCYICKKEGDFNVHENDEFVLFHLCNDCLNKIKS